MMRTLKVFVLSEQHHVDYETSLEVLVFSTKTAAKAELLRRKDEVLEDFKEGCGNEWEVYENHATFWGISSTDSDVWTELLVTETEVKS